MPVSYLPCIVPLLLVGVPLLLLAKGRRAATIASAVSMILVGVFLLAVYVPGWWLHAKAARGDPAAQYAYAQWLENHGDELGAILPWPAEPDVLDGYAWLDRAAAQNYPPAVWLVGVRLKEGTFVPEPSGWTGPAGNLFPQPQRGQAMINRAVNQLGYTAPASEETFYWQHYRKGLPP